MWWLNAFRMPSIRLPARDSDELSRVPCANSGTPLQLDSTYPIYRDCSKPDLARVRRAPWVHPEDLTRTVAGAPVAIDKLARGTLGAASAAAPEPPRGSRVAPITATAISGGLLVATGLGFWRWSSLQADIRRYQWSNTGAGRAAWSDAVGRTARWRNLTWTGIGATFVGAAVSAFLWNRHERPLISAAPAERGAGASVTLGGAF